MFFATYSCYQSGSGFQPRVAIRLFSLADWLVGWLRGSHAEFQGRRVNDRPSKEDGSWMAFLVHRLLIVDRAACDGISGFAMLDNVFSVL